MRLRDLTVAGALIAACLIAFSVAADYLVDWVWFSSVGYRGIFRTVLVTKIVIFFAVFFSSAAFIWGNGALSLRFSQHLPSVQSQLRIGDRPNTFSVFVRADQVSIGSLAVADADWGPCDRSWIVDRHRGGRKLGLGAAVHLSGTL